MTIIGDIPGEIREHAAHQPGHKLMLRTGDDRAFQCDGCMEPGTGTWFRCEHDHCNFDLHTCCALAPATLTHPLFGGDRTFVFLVEPPGEDRRVCDACGDDVRGFVFHNFDRGLDLHPCCADLPERLVMDDHVFQLRRAAASRPCGACGRRNRKRSSCRDFWVFRSSFGGETVELHVACMKEMARLSWDAGRRNQVGGGQIVQLRGLTAQDVLQSLPSQARGTGGRFNRFVKIVGVVMSVIVAVIFGNPMAMIAAVAGPGGLLRG